MGEPLMSVTGYDGTIQVFEDRVVILRKRDLLTTISYMNAGDISVPYDTITGVEFKDASRFINGYIRLIIKGRSQRIVPSAITKGAPISINDSQVLLKKGEQCIKGKEIADYILSRLSESENKSLQMAEENQVVSVADELLKFKQLLDMGAITEDEFKKIKDQLLGESSP